MTKIEGISLVKYIISGGYKYRNTLLTSLTYIINSIHSSGVIHADYGPHNVIINSNFLLHVIDFGESVMPCGNIDEMKQDDINEMYTSVNNIIAYMYLGGVQVSEEDKDTLQTMSSSIFNEIQSLRNPVNWVRMTKYIGKYM